MKVPAMPNAPPTPRRITASKLTLFFILAANHIASSAAQLNWGRLPRHSKPSERCLNSLVTTLYCSSPTGCATSRHVARVQQHELFAAPVDILLLALKKQND